MNFHLLPVFSATTVTFLTTAYLAWLCNIELDRLFGMTQSFLIFHHVDLSVFVVLFANFVEQCYE
jgi:hypothetical protein